MLVEEEIHAALETAFTPRELTVRDVSESHRGHAGYQDGGQSHFDVVIVAEAFENMSRLARHRAVHEALGPALISRIHALALDIKA
jgi:BolA protein